MHVYVSEALSIHYVRFIYGVVVAALDDSTTVVSSTKEHMTRGILFFVMIIRDHVRDYCNHFWCKSCWRLCMLDLTTGFAPLSLPYLFCIFLFYCFSLLSCDRVLLIVDSAPPPLLDNNNIATLNNTPSL